MMLSLPYIQFSIIKNGLVVTCMFCFLNYLYIKICTFRIVSTDYLGNNPFAVSPESIVQSVRSRTALVTSDIYALEGLTLFSID